MEEKKYRPFLKWAGGKYRLLDRILPNLTEGKRFIEPFLGAGSVFLNTSYKRYLLNDSNPDLINLYQILQREGTSFVKELRQYFHKKNNNAERYYALRDQFNRTTDNHQRAAIFLYMNRHGYNGLCRYNSKGIYNVPFGRYVNPRFPEEALLAFIEKSQYATFTCQPFEKCLQKAKAGDIVYCDPPYVPLSKSAAFTRYTGQCFDMTAQQRLADCASSAQAQGAKVILSNHDTIDTRRFYAEAKHIQSFSIRRHLSCKGHQRVAVRELIAVYESS